MNFKQMYINCVDTLTNYTKKEQELYKATNGTLDLFNVDELVELQFHLVQLLTYITNDCYAQEGSNAEISNLDYYLYELDSGNYSVDENGKSRITDENGESIFARNAEELFDNLVLPNMRKIDKLRFTDTDKVADFIMSCKDKSKEEIISKLNDFTEDEL